MRLWEIKSSNGLLTDIFVLEASSSRELFIKLSELSDMPSTEEITIKEITT